MIGQATKRETIPSPLGALLPITYQVHSLSQYFILPITFQFPKGTHKSIIENTSFIPFHLTFFQKLRKCVNWIVASPLTSYAFVTVKGVPVVMYLRDSIFFRQYFFLDSIFFLYVNSFKFE